MPLLPNQWNNSVAQASLAPVASVPEYYEELWWYSGGYISPLTYSTDYAQKGTTSPATTNTGSSVKLFTLNASTPASTKFALEGAIWPNSNGYQASICLYDLTVGAVVSGSTVSNTTAAATVVRSGQFTLTPGNTYAVQLSTPGNSCYFTDISLVIFPQ